MSHTSPIPYRRIAKNLIALLQLAGVGLLTHHSPVALAQEDGCVSESSPNPHAQEYPDFVSGNLNGTTLVVPIPLTTARRVIPEEYGILEHVYRALLPASFPDDAYPMMAVGVHDHDIQFPLYDVHSADFSVSRPRLFLFCQCCLLVSLLSLPLKPPSIHHCSQYNGCAIESIEAHMVIPASVPLSSSHSSTY